MIKAILFLIFIKIGQENIKIRKNKCNYVEVFDNYIQLIYNEIILNKNFFRGGIYERCISIERFRLYKSNCSSS